MVNMLGAGQRVRESNINIMRRDKVHHPRDLSVLDYGEAEEPLLEA